MSFPAFLQTSFLPDATKEKISWSSHWNASLPIIRETESEEVGMRTERAV